MCRHRNYCISITAVSTPTCRSHLCSPLLPNVAKAPARSVKLYPKLARPKCCIHNLPPSALRFHRISQFPVLFCHTCSSTNSPRHARVGAARRASRPSGTSDRALEQLRRTFFAAVTSCARTVVWRGWLAQWTTRLSAAHRATAACSDVGGWIAITSAPAGLRRGLVSAQATVAQSHWASIHPRLGKARRQLMHERVVLPTFPTATRHQ